MRVIRRILLGAVVLFAAAVITAVVMIKQPTFGVIEAVSSGTSAEPARLEAHVRMLSETFAPRDFANVENLDRAAAYIADELEAAGGRVGEQTFEVAGRTYRNVVATFGPESAERIVVGAHYDACEPLPGADDNASGVAGLLELGRMLGPTRLSSRVDLVAYSLEEPPYFRTEYMGSHVHAKSLRDEGATVRAMICLEMLGYFSDAPGSQAYPIPLLGALYPDRGDFIAIVGRFGGGGLVRHVKRAFRGATDLPTATINAPASLRGVDFSDHLNYWKYGYPAVMLTDTAFYRNPAYHTADDTAERLDYERMGKVVDGVFNAVVSLANRP